MKNRTFVTFSTLVFTLIAAMHLIRFAQGWPVLMGTVSVPVWASLLAMLVFGVVAIWGFSLLLRRA